MESKRAFLAIFLSLGILLAYQYLVVVPSAPVNQAVVVDEEATPQTAAAPISSPPPAALSAIQPEPARPARDVRIETSLYTAVVTEAGGGLKSLKLKQYREDLAKDSGPKELVVTREPVDLPFYFSWGTDPDALQAPFFEADREALVVRENTSSALVMRSRLASGLEIVRTMVFRDDDYRIDLQVEVLNNTADQLTGAPALRLASRPLLPEHQTQGMFMGPALYAGGELQQFETDDLLKEGAKTVTGTIDWAAYEDTYFMLAAIPEVGPAAPNAARFSVVDGDKTVILLSGVTGSLPPGGRAVYNYTLYSGPKKLSILKRMGTNLDRIVDFGWFDALARPTLYLLNFLYGYLKNYGVAIILVTVLIKLAFWPIASKGMRSMKNMQKIQPKLAKLREKYKDDRERLNVEMMNLYKTYKVNPLGGCLPMFLQIPVFFALYKVLLQAIELRHAPFMFWINDLSAPDRLFIGFDIPYLGGLPVLTLLMGGSMFLQQKMTPTSADPAQARVMMFLPVIFTFMFLNFASGLVLYWFVNNLLAMAQQYLINRQVED